MKTRVYKKDYINWQVKIKEIFNHLQKNLHTCFLTFLNYCMKYYDLDENVAKQVGNFKNNDYKKIFGQ